jgi:4-hydroxy-3-methylbut-2-enyl diphosphate reductase
VALAAVMLIAIVPWVHDWVDTNGWALPRWGALVPLVLSSAFVFLLALVRSVAVDFRQIEGDLLLGRETLPVILGRNRTHRMIVGILAALAILAVGGLAVEPLRNGLILLAPVALMGLIYGLTYAQKVRSYLLWVFLLDLPFLAAGALALM